MPPALAVSPLAQMSLSQSLLLGNGLAQSQSNSLGSLLQQYHTGTPLELAMSGIQPSQAYIEAMRLQRVAYAQRRACEIADEGEKIIDRIVFWSSFGIVAQPILSRLADKLESISVDVERYVEMAS